MVKKVFLRPHHLSFLDSYVQNKAKPEDYAVLTQIYGPDTVKRLDSFYSFLSQNIKDIEITVVDGIDDICKLCCYKPGCETKNYAPALDIARKVIKNVYRIELGNENPTTLDQAIMDKHPGIQVGKTYSLSELSRLLQTYDKPKRH